MTQIDFDSIGNIGGSTDYAYVRAVRPGDYAFTRSVRGDRTYVKRNKIRKDTCIQLRCLLEVLRHGEYGAADLCTLLCAHFPEVFGRVIGAAKFMSILACAQTAGVCVYEHDVTVYRANGLPGKTTARYGISVDDLEDSERSLRVYEEYHKITEPYSLNPHR